MSVSRTSWALRVALTILSVSTVFFVGFGCSQNPAENSNRDASTLKMEWLQSQNADGAQRSLGVSSVVFETTMSQMVGDGKEVKFKFESDKDKVEFKFDKDCVNRPTLITIHAQKLESPYGPIWVFDCGPEGTVFNPDKPVELRATGQYHKDYVALWLFNEATGEWEISDLLDAHGFKRNWDIFHFSKYGIS